MKNLKKDKIDINWRRAGDSVTEGVLAIDPGYKIIDCNRVLCSLLGKDKKDIIGKKCYKLLHGKNKRPKECYISKAKRQHRKLEIELYEPYLDRSLYLSGNCYFDRNGKFLYGVHVVKDITEQKRLEYMRDNLIRDVSHGLKTPIAMARMAFNICSQGIKAQDMELIKKAYHMASANLRKLQNDVDNILEIFSLDKKKATILQKKKKKKKKKNSLTKALNEVITELKYFIGNKKLKLKTDIQREANKLMVEERDMKTLMYNIIENAIKFTERGTISITSRLKDKRIRIKVKDTGCGLTPDDKDKVFDRFYKRHIANEGVGLGLSICKEIVGIYNGKIQIISKGRGKGTMVIVELPKGG